MPDFRPLDDPEAPPRPPVYPSRLRSFIYACADHAFTEAVKLAGGKITSRQRR